MQTRATSPGTDTSYASLELLKKILLRIGWPYTELEVCRRKLRDAFALLCVWFIRNIDFSRRKIYDL